MCLFLGLQFFAPPVDAGTKCDDILSTIQEWTTPAEQVLRKVWVFPQEQVAKLWTPNAIKKFSLEEFLQSRAYYEATVGGTEISPLSRPTSFEQRLALFEVLQVKNEDSRFLPGEFFETGSRLDQKRLYAAIHLVIPKKRISRSLLNFRLEKLDALLLKDQYPSVFSKVSAEQIEGQLKDVVALRLTQENVFTALRQMGLIRKNNGFQQFFESALLTDQFGLMNLITLDMDEQILTHLRSLKFKFPGVILPEFNRLKRIKIPNVYLVNAMKTSLAQAWEQGFGDYMFRRYEGRVKRDLIYKRIRSTWNRTVVAVYLSYSIYSTAVDLPKIPEQAMRVVHQVTEQYQFMQKAQVIFKNSKPFTEQQINTLPRVLPKSIQESQWEHWVTTHPEAARNPNSEEYQAAHDVIFNH